MRARKAATALLDPANDESRQPFPSDEPIDEEPRSYEEPLSFDRVCLDCGGRLEGCEHRERVSFAVASPVIRGKIERLRRAAAEHRAALRALRALATSEHARGRADLEIAPPPALPEPDSFPVEVTPAPPTALAAHIDPPAAPPPCPRCAERASLSVDAGASAPAPAPIDASAPPAPAPRRARKKPALPAAQSAFDFLSEPAPPLSP